VIRDRNSTPNAASYSDRVDLAREFTDILPGESRLMVAVATGYLMTPEGQKEDNTATYRRGLAMAWLPFNVDQALAVAKSLPEKQKNSGYDIRNETLQDIVVWLLTDPARRNKRLLSGYDQYGFDPPNY
jgi:hypothetical protein